MEDWKSSISTDSTGWWFQPTPLKKMMDFVSWDDDIPNMMGKSKKTCSKPPTSHIDKTELATQMTVNVSI